MKTKFFAKKSKKALCMSFLWACTFLIVYAQTETNIALNKPVTSNSPYGYNTALNALINDGNAGTRWSSLWQSNQSVTIDLEEAYYIEKVIIDWETACAASYKVQISLDGNSFTDVYYDSQGNGGSDEIFFSVVRARYVRMLGITPATQWGFSIFEMKVYKGEPEGTVADFHRNSTDPVYAGIPVCFTDVSSGTPTGWSWTFPGATPAATTAQNPCVTYGAPGRYNVTLTISSAAGTDSETKSIEVFKEPPGNVALNKPVTSDAPYNDNPELNALVNDGDQATRWASKWENNQSLTIDLQVSFLISKVVLQWETAFANQYKIQGSSDGSVWSDIVHITNGNGAVDELEFSTRSVRYVRILCVNAATIWGFSIYEMEVYGYPDTTKLLKPIADAGEDKKLYLPENSVIINGSGIDYDGNIVSYAWTKISGPPATLSSENTASLTVSDLSAEGTYEFRLTVTDNDGLSDHDDVAVILGSSDPDITELLLNSCKAYENMRLSNGVYKDAIPLSGGYKPAGIAANGIGLISLCISDGMYQKTRDAKWGTDAEEKVMETLQVFSDFSYTAHFGLYHRYFNPSNFMPDGDWSYEISTIDNAILASGFLFCRNYFSHNQDIYDLANALLTAMDFSFAVPISGNQIYMVVNENGTVARPTSPFNEYMVVAWFAKHVDPSFGGFGKAQDFWNRIYENPGGLLKNSYGGYDVLSFKSGVFVSSFAIQFCYYYINHFSKHTGYMDYFSNAQKADLQWWKNVTGQSAAWGCGAGDIPGGLYSPDAINNNGNTIVSPHIMSGFLPVYSQAEEDLAALYNQGSGPAVYTIPGSSDKVLWRYKYYDTYPRAQYIQAVDYSTMLYGLATLDQHLGAKFFEDHNDFTPQMKPHAEAGEDQSVIDEDDNGSETILLDGTASNDPDGSIVSYVWSESGIQIATGANASVSLETGTHTLTLTVTDNKGASDSDDVTIVIDPYQTHYAPTADAGPDQTVTDTDDNGSETVTLNGTGSHDSDGHIVSYVWTASGNQIATGATPSVILANGRHTITLTVTDNDALTDTDVVVITVNDPPPPFELIIQAEDFTNQSGIQTENTSDAGGGLNVGWIDPGDWMSYNIDIPADGTYRIEYRVASRNGGGILRFDRDNGNVIIDNNVNLPNTGGWQNWETVTNTITLEAGNRSYGIYAIAGGWNFNWFKISAASAKSAEREHGLTRNSLSVFPNPAGNSINLAPGSPEAWSLIQIHSVTGVPVKSIQTGNKRLIKVDISDLNPGIYFIKATGENTQIQKFIKE